MIVFPNCKINIGLNVLAKRSDGFHDLETVFYPLPLYDALEINERPAMAGPVLRLTGIQPPAAPEENICLKAYFLLKADFPSLPNIQMHLHKTIPVGAGLGGGSSDGAFALKLLNEKFGLELTAGQLSAYALRLGSDCPFFLYNRPCLAYGRGETLKPIDLNLSTFKWVVVHPGIHISTASAFSRITPKAPAARLQELIGLPPEAWKARIVNQFETTVFELHPELARIKEQLYDAGAFYASMSGSGSALYGLFEKLPSEGLAFPAHYTVKIL